MKMNASQKIIVMASILAVFALACSTFSSSPTGGDLPHTPDADLARRPAGGDWKKGGVLKLAHMTTKGAKKT